MTAFVSDGRISFQVAVSDLDRAVAFYRDVLGLKEIVVSSEYRWAEFETGIPGCTIGMGVDPGGVGPCQSSIRFGVTDLDAARQALQERGVRFEQEEFEVGGQVRIALFQDPDGNPMLLEQRLS